MRGVRAAISESCDIRRPTSTTSSERRPSLSVAVSLSTCVPVKFISRATNLWALSSKVF